MGKKLNSTLRTSFLLVAAALSLSACSGSDMRQSMGLKRNNPDEFQVVSRPPLSVPPVYHLRPPSDEQVGINPADARAKSLLIDGEEMPLYKRPEDRDPIAKTAVANVQSNALGTQADAVLLRNAGASQANPDIRDIIEDESAQYAPTAPRKRSLMDKMQKGWFVPDNGDPVVDASKEQARIRANKAADKPLTEGETPVSDPKDKGFLDSIF